MIETTIFKYFVDDKICHGLEGTNTKQGERISLEYFDETINKWICTSIILQNKRYRIRHETRKEEISSGFTKFSMDYSKPICQKCKRDCDIVEEQLRQDDTWEQRRYEIARDMLPNAIDQAWKNYELTSDQGEIGMAVTASIEIADELIKQLKENKC